MLLRALSSFLFALVLLAALAQYNGAAEELAILASNSNFRLVCLAAIVFFVGIPAISNTGPATMR